MGFELASGFKDLCGYLFSSTFFNGLFSNSFYMAIMITIIIALILVLMYPSKPKTLISTSLRVLLYIFITVLATLILHNGLVKNKYDIDHTDQKEMAIIKKITGGKKEHIIDADIETIEIQPELIPLDLDDNS